MMIDQPDRNPGCRTDAAYGHSLVPILFQAAQRRIDERFAAHRGGCSANFGCGRFIAMGLYHFRGAVDEGADALLDVAPDVQVVVFHGREVSMGMHSSADAFLD